MGHKICHLQFSHAYLGKSSSQDKMTLSSEEIKPAALAISELYLSEGIR